MDSIDKIRLRQVLTFGPQKMRLEPPVEPRIANAEILYLGCIEAKLDPHKHIGLPIRRTIIHRHAGAFMHGLDTEGKAFNRAEACDVQLAVNGKKVKHIVVAAHTCCAGLQACMDGCNHPDMNHVHDFMKVLEPLRQEAINRYPDDHAARMHELEEAAVRKSLENLMTYPFVRAAYDKGELQLHGWVLDIDTKQISEMDPETKKFEPMATKYAAMANSPEAMKWQQLLKNPQRLRSL